MKNKSLLKIILSILITISILFIFFKKISFQEIIKSFESITIEAFLVFVLIYLIGSVLRAIRYQILLDNKIDFKTMILITFVRNFSVDLLPARTGSLIFYTYLTKTYGIEVYEGIISFIISIIYDLLSLSIILSFSLFFLSSNKYKEIFMFLLSAVFIVSILLIIFIEKVLDFLLKIKFIKRNDKIRKHIQNIRKYFVSHNSFKERIKIFVLSLFIRLSKYSAVFVLFLSLTRIEISFEKFFIFAFGISSTEISSIIPIQGIAGFGTWELTFNYVFKLIDLSIKEPFLVGFIIHVITQIFEYSVGIISFLYLNLKFRKL